MDLKEVPLPKENWYLLLATFPMTALLNSTTGIFAVMYVKLAMTFQVGMATAGGITAVQFTSMCLFGLLSSTLANQHGCRTVAIAGSLMISTSLFISAFSINIWMMYLTFGFTCGLGMGFIEMSTNVFVQQLFHVNRNLGTFITLSAMGVGTAAGPLWASFLMSHFGWRGALIIHSAVMLHCLFFALFFKSPDIYKGKVQLTLKEIVDFSVLQNSSFLLFCLVVFMYFWNAYAFFSHLASRAILVLHVHRTQAALLPTIVGTTVAIGRFLLAFVLNKPLFSRRKSIVLATAIFIQSLIAGPGTWLLAKDYITTIIVVVGYAIFQACITPLIQTVIVELEGVENFPRANAIVNLPKSVAILFSVPVAGWIYDVTGNYNLPFLINGFISLIAGALCFIVSYVANRKRKERGTKDAINDGCENQLTEQNA